MAVLDLLLFPRTKIVFVDCARISCASTSLRCYPFEGHDSICHACMRENFAMLVKLSVTQRRTGTSTCTLIATESNHTRLCGRQCHEWEQDADMLTQRPKKYDIVHFVSIRKIMQFLTGWKVQWDRKDAGAKSNQEIQKGEQEKWWQKEIFFPTGKAQIITHDMKTLKHVMVRESLFFLTSQFASQIEVDQQLSSENTAMPGDTMWHPWQLIKHAVSEISYANMKKINQQYKV